ncbi:hypothetical protein GP486_006984, partial [Trichoglossum hirsutum]
MPPKRMTANPVRPARYRPGKPIAAEPESSEYEDSDEEAEDAGQEPAAPPPPKASSFPSDSTRIASNLKKVDLSERREHAAAREAARLEAQALRQAQEEEGFVTEESEDEESEGEEESGSEAEEETSDEEEQPKKVLLRPTFIKKEKRAAIAAKAREPEEEKRVEEEGRRKADADEIVEEQLRRDAAARAAGKKFWDDDEGEDADAVDDTDGLDPETERALWKLRELKRVKREREIIEQAEKEREEVERRRNLSKEEREEEDREFLARQREEKESKGKMGYLQKYYHKGAFFQDDQREMGLDKRDIMGSRYQDDVTNRELLPQYMQVRDMTRLGKKGRTKYKDLKAEDTGRWGAFDDRAQRRGGEDRKAPAAPTPLDERFTPSHERERRAERTGANASEVADRKRPVEGAPAGPRAMRDRTDSYRPGGGPEREDDDARHGRRRREYSPRRRSRSRSRSRS